MSMNAFRWAKAEIMRSNKSLRSTEAFVLLMLADHYNDDWGRAWPSYETLAAETALSRRAVINVVSDLESRGLLQTEKWVVAASGLSMPNRFLLPMFRPEVRPSSRQPVVAFKAWESEVPRDEMREVPKSGLYIEHCAL